MLGFGRFSGSGVGPVRLGSPFFPQHLVEGLLFSRRRVYDRSGRKSVLFFFDLCFFVCCCFFLRFRCFVYFLFYEGLFNKYFIMLINNFRTRFSLHNLFLFYGGLFNKDSIMQINNFRTRFSLHKLS